MHALLRYLYATGSFVTAPAPHALSGAQLARDLEAEQHGAPAGSAQAVAHAQALERDDQLDVGALTLPPLLASLPLFDLSGASVPLPDTLPYRHLLLHAAHGAGDETQTDKETGCPWPAMHPRLASAFQVPLTPAQPQHS